MYISHCVVHEEPSAGEIAALREFKISDDWLCSFLVCCEGCMFRARLPRLVSVCLGTSGQRPAGHDHVYLILLALCFSKHEAGSRRWKCLQRFLVLLRKMEKSIQNHQVRGITNIDFRTTLAANQAPPLQKQSRPASHKALYTVLLLWPNYLNSLDSSFSSQT
jgi:hypothetical protein